MFNIRDRCYTQFYCIKHPYLQLGLKQTFKPATGAETDVPAHREFFSFVLGMLASDEDARPGRKGIPNNQNQNFLKWSK